MPYKLNNFDGLLIPEFLERGDTQNMGVGMAASDFVQMPGGGFFDNYGEFDSPRELSPIQKQCVLYDTGSLTVREQVEELKAKLGKRGRLEALWHDGVVRWLWARLVRVNYTRPFNARRLHLPIDVTFAPATGVWYAENEVREDTVFAGATTTADIVIVNPGNVNVTDAIIEVISPIAGTLTLEFENYATSQKVTMASFVGVGDTMVLDIGQRTARVIIAPAAITTISRSANVITVDTSGAHGLSVDDEVRVEGTDYDGFYIVETVVDTDTVELTADPLVRQAHGPQSPVAGTIAQAGDIYGNMVFSDAADWFWLVPGTQTIHLTSSADLDGGTFSVIYNPTYA